MSFCLQSGLKFISGVKVDGDIVGGKTLFFLHSVLDFLLQRLDHPTWTKQELLWFLVLVFFGFIFFYLASHLESQQWDGWPYKLNKWILKLLSHSWGKVISKIQKALSLYAILTIRQQNPLWTMSLNIHCMYKYNLFFLQNKQCWWDNTLLVHPKSFFHTYVLFDYCRDLAYKCH